MSRRRRYWCWCEDECPRCSDDYLDVAWPSPTAGEVVGLILLSDDGGVDYLDVIEHGEADACDETAERWVNPPAPVEGVGA